MAQLRDAETSELLVEGTAEDLVLIADELGTKEVLFDDVGLHFDPGAVRAVREERLAADRGLSKAKDAKAAAAAKERLRASAETDRERAELAREAEAALTRARAKG